jgi:hypothetical protein
MQRFGFLTIFLFLHCSQDLYILREPINGERPGAIGFGLFLFQSNADVSPKSIRIIELNHFSTTFTNHSSAQPSDFVFHYGETKLENQKENVKYISATNTILESEGKKSFYLISGLNPDHEYSLRSVSYSFTMVIYNANGSTSNRTYFVTLPIDAGVGKDLLKIRVVPNQIRYLGIFGVKETVTEPGVTIFRIGETKKGVLVKGEEVIAKSGDPTYQQRFFGSEAMNFQGGRDHFYSLFSKTHPTGYWSSIAKD